MKAEGKQGRRKYLRYGKATYLSTPLRPGMQAPAPASAGGSPRAVPARWAPHDLRRPANGAHGGWIPGCPRTSRPLASGSGARTEMQRRNKRSRSHPLRYPASRNPGSGYLVGWCMAGRRVGRRRTWSRLRCLFPCLRPETSALLRGALSPARRSERASWKSMPQTKTIQRTAARRTIQIRVRDCISVLHGRLGVGRNAAGTVAWAARPGGLLE